MLAVLQEVAHRRPYEVLMLLKPSYHPSPEQSLPTHVVQHQSMHKEPVSKPMSDQGGRDTAAFANALASKHQASQPKLSSSSDAQFSDSTSDCKLQGPDLRIQGHQPGVRGSRAVASSKLPNGLVMVAVPGEHSRKPQLAHLLQPYLPAKPKCLEVSKTHTARTSSKTSCIFCSTNGFGSLSPDKSICADDLV